ncbi:MAG: TusE/DsrC/DsvC family sulfur relay protein [Thiohalocapsa sp.]|nr:TusE/DsrC/DsvC family sulfur relay protein [Thiohalocapsa sp.]
MITVRVYMRATGEPLKRTPVVLELDPDAERTPAIPTDRQGEARFDTEAESGKVLVSGVERYHGRLGGEIEIGLWSILEPEDSSAGNPGEFPAGSNAYEGMETRALRIGGRLVVTDGEGYLVNPSDWSEDFARALAEAEGLKLDARHWAMIRFLREHFRQHGTQASVRDMVKHFRTEWGRDEGSSAALHRLFPRGGPQKQGNRLAGLLRTKGEH